MWMANSHKSSCHFNVIKKKKSIKMDSEGFLIILLKAFKGFQFLWNKNSFFIAIRITPLVFLFQGNAIKKKV